MKSFFHTLQSICLINPVPLYAEGFPDISFVKVTFMELDPNKLRRKSWLNPLACFLVRSLG